MIIATAGHVDHGKTSLVRHLTGVNTDRLAEEKQRGLSINLGYAYLPREQGLPLGFIDVPGHRRFINNMICGVSGIDMGMLLVAADDGPMPQTIEHLDVLHILGVERLVVVISKVDRVDPQRVDAVGEAADALCAERGWHDVQRFAVSNASGEGVAELQDYLAASEQAIRQQLADEYFRMSVDRAFHMKGAGLVVTGTCAAGSVGTGEELRLMPANVAVKVRTVRVHDAPTERAGAAQRCALNITGDVSLEKISRGNWLVLPGAAVASTRIDVAVQLLPHATQALKHMAPVKLYLGAARCSARLSLLETSIQHRELAPGQRCLAQLELTEPVCAVRNERFLLRDDSGEILLGGGTIIDPAGSRPDRPRERYLARANAMDASDHAVALAQRLALGDPVLLDTFATACNQPLSALEAVVPEGAQRYEAAGRHYAIAGDTWQDCARALTRSLREWHAAHPAEPGVAAVKLTGPMKRDYSDHLLLAVLSKQVQSGTLVLAKGLLRLAGYTPTRLPEQEAAWQAYRRALDKAGTQIPLLSELESSLERPKKVIERIAHEAVRDGRLHKVSERRHALPRHLDELAGGVLAVAARGEPLSVIALKGEWQVGRNLTVEILEYFDSIRFTQRRGDERVILDEELPRRLYRNAADD